MSETNVNIGPFQTSARTLWRMLCYPVRQVAGTPGLDKKVCFLQSHLAAVTDVLYSVMAEVIQQWPSEKRERVLRSLANFEKIDEGLESIKPSGNPFTEAEAERLRLYSKQAQEGEWFSPSDAADFRALSERAATEYASQDWVNDLLKVALFTFALYALYQVLKK